MNNDYISQYLIDSKQFLLYNVTQQRLGDRLGNEIGEDEVEQSRYVVAISGYTHPHQVNDVAGLIEQRPQPARVVFGFSTGFHVQLESELGRRPGLYVPLLQCGGLRGRAETSYLAHFTPDLSSSFPVIEQVRLLYTFVGSWLDGVQINNPRLDIDQLGRIVELDSSKDIVYPLGRTSLHRIIRDGVSEYGRLQQVLACGVSTLLLDNSAGKGEPLTYDELSDCLEELWRATDVTLRIAGRLGRTPQDLEVISQLLHDYPDQQFGWEVESRLRTPDDRFSVGAARKYLEESFALIRQNS